MKMKTKLSVLPYFNPSSELLEEHVDKLIESGEVEEVSKRVRDIFSGLIIAYRRRYVLKSEFTPDEKDVEIQKFFKKWVRKSIDKILKYIYKKYPEYFYKYPYRLFDSQNTKD